MEIDRPVANQLDVAVMDSVDGIPLTRTLIARDSRQAVYRLTVDDETYRVPLRSDVDGPVECREIARQISLARADDFDPLPDWRPEDGPWNRTEARE